MSSFVTYLKNVRAELKHVVWPDKGTALSHTIMILLISAITAVLIALLDYAFTGIVSRLIAG